MSEKLTIQDLARGAADRLGMTKGNAEAFVKEFFQLIADALHQDKYVKIKGFGTFKLIDVDSRASVDVNTGERIEIQGHIKVSFTPDAALRDVINRPFAHFETVPLQNEALLLSTEVEEESATAEEKSIISEPCDSPQTTTSESTLVKPELIEPAPIESAQTESLPMEEDYPPLEETLVEPVSTVDSAPVMDPVPVMDPAVIGEDSENAAASSLEQPLSEEEMKERKQTMKFFIGIVVFISLLCIGVLVFIYFPGLTRALYGLKAPVEQTTSDTLSQAVDTLPSVVSPTESGSSVSLPSQEAKKSLPESKPVQVMPVQPDSSTYEIVGTLESYTLKEGETLTRVSLHYWGTKNLWPYLVKHNPALIKNPDNVPYGTTIQIPKLKKK